MQLNTALQNRQADSMADITEAGASAGVLNVYDGTPPTDANEALGGQTLLASITLPEPAFGDAATGTADFQGTWEDNNVDASGTASWFRLEDSDGTYVIQGTVGGTGSGEDMEVDDPNLVAGGTFSITSLSITQPGS